MSNSPPFADLDAYALALRGLVPDSKAGHTNAEFIESGLEAYNDHYTAWATADVGDDTTKEWQLGKAAEPFSGFLLGYSDLFPIEVEELDEDDEPYDRRVSVSKGWRIDERVVSGDPVKFIMFEDAPASTAKRRVRWRVQWAADKVPATHQRAVVYFAAQIKCLALASKYRNTVDAGSDLFDGDGTAEGYKSDARVWRAKALSKLGIGAQKTVEHGRARPSRRRVFHRGIP